MKTTRALKSESFSYPTIEELKLYNKEIPKITRLNIEYKSALINFLEKKNIYNAINEEDTYWWNLCLNNKFGKLSQTYLYLLTHYNRFKKFERNENEFKFTEGFLQDYYVEIFYYYFYSVRDIIGQLINVIYKLEIDETKISLNKFLINKLPDAGIKLIFEDFIKETYNSNKNFRNAFTHRFTPTQKDNRAKTTISISDDEKEIGFGLTGKEISKEELYEDSKKLMNQLSVLMKSFNEYISLQQHYS